MERDEHTIDTLVLAVVVNELEAAKNLDGRNVSSCLINHTLRTMRDKVFQKNQCLFQNVKCNEPVFVNTNGPTVDAVAHVGRMYLVNLSPFPGFLLCEPLEDGRHDLVEVLAMRISKVVGLV